MLTDFLKFKNLFVHHEVLAPEFRASRPHFHTMNEEMVFILAGNPTAYINNQTTQLKPGDFIRFIPEANAKYFIKNNTTEEVRFLIICSNPEKDQTVYG